MKHFEANPGQAQDLLDSCYYLISKLKDVMGNAPTEFNDDVIPSLRILRGKFMKNVAMVARQSNYKAEKLAA